MPANGQRQHEGKGEHVGVHADALGHERRNAVDGDAAPLHELHADRRGSARAEEAAERRVHARGEQLRLPVGEARRQRAEGRGGVPSRVRRGT